MEFIADYKNGSAFVRDFGKDRLEMLEMTAQLVHAKDCPFCGGAAALTLSRFPAPGCAIECQDCHSKTLFFPEGSRVGTRELPSIYDCLAEALARWNKRQ